jgi:hypothetical protein
MIWNIRLRRHISDATLTEWSAERWAPADLPPDLVHHLEACPRCSQRRDDLVDMLDDLGPGATTEAEAELTPGRLQDQRRRIMRRLATLVGSEAPAKVLRFPARIRTTPTVMSRNRWLPAAMAAGLLVGVLVGRLLDFDTADRAENVVVLAAADGDAFLAASRANALRGAQGVQNDEVILTEIDAALEAPSVDALSDLDALTPRIQEVALAGR